MKDKILSKTKEKTNKLKVMLSCVFRVSKESDTRVKQTILLVFSLRDERDVTVMCHYPL